MTDGITNHSVVVGMRRWWWRVRYAAIMRWRTLGSVRLRDCWDMSREGYEMSKWGSSLDSPSDAVDSERSYWTD